MSKPKAETRTLLWAILVLQLLSVVLLTLQVFLSEIRQDRQSEVLAAHTRILGGLAELLTGVPMSPPE